MNNYFFYFAITLLFSVFYNCTTTTEIFPKNLLTKVEFYKYSELESIKIQEENIKTVSICGSVFFTENEKSIPDLIEKLKNDNPKVEKWNSIEIYQTVFPSCIHLSAVPNNEK